MFRQRLLTALVLIPLVLCAIYQANEWLLGSIVLLLMGLGAWEWARLIPIHALFNKLIFIAVFLGFIVLAGAWFDYFLVSGLLLWALILLAVLTFPASQAFWGHRVLVGGACLLLLPLATNSLAAIYQLPEGRHLIVYLLCLVWATDTGAYLVGKRWGRTKLIPVVSPGKTVEGALSGFILAMLIASFGCFWIKPPSFMLWYVVAVFTVLISMLGDLFISVLKRRFQLKDTGHIFPGHGGLLDRIDSLIAALPVFYLGLGGLGMLK